MKTIPLLFLIILFTHSDSVSSGKQFGGLTARTNTTWTASQTWFNINNISTRFRNDGQCDRDLVSPSGGSAFVFPKGTRRTAIFESGVVWGAKINDSLHVGGSSYLSGLQPGKILSPGIAEDPNLPKNRIYRIRPDYATADLSSEASDEDRSQEEIRAQYALDWNFWPAADGAPFDDRNGNGTYEPGVDVPGRHGADQTIWYVCNDLDSALTLAFHGTLPMGIEVQVTVWGYARQGALDNIVFKNYRLINKSTSAFDSMYVCQWSDVDLGDAANDFAGCDTALGLGFCYNSSPSDYVYSPLIPPAVGFQFLSQQMTAGFYDAAGNTWGMPPFGSYEGAREWYNFLHGLMPVSGLPFIHPVFPGQPTKFWLDGDPVTASGRVDGILDSPSDRLIGSCIGPFAMIQGDTQNVATAVLIGMGSNYLTSVSTLRDLARAAKSMYDGILVSVPPNVNGQVVYPNASQATVKIIADGRQARALSINVELHRQDGSIISLLALFDDGTHGDSGAHDGIWANSITILREHEGIYVNASVVDSMSRNFTWDRIVDDFTIAGPVNVGRWKLFSDNLNNNGQINPGENVRYGIVANNATPFTVSRLLVFPNSEPDVKMFAFGIINPSSVDSMIYDPDSPLSYFTFNAPISDTVLVISYALSDTSHNRWTEAITLPIIPFQQPVQNSMVNHVAGRSEWLFNVSVVDPPSVNNHHYEISIVDSLDSVRTKGFNLRDMDTGSFLLTKHPLPDQFGHNIPVTDGFKVMRGQNFGPIGLRQDSTRWISQNPAWLGGNRFAFDLQGAFGGGVTTGFRLDQYLGAVTSNFDPSRSMPVEVRFDATSPQKAYRLRRSGIYLIQSSDPFVDVPFSVWDVSDRSNPRQLTLAWRDNDNSTTWNPQVEFDGTEIVFIYNKTYDPTGTTQFSMPPNAIPNECTVGDNADIVYGLALYVLSGHTLSESPGTLYLRPWLALNSDDRFTFNPTVVLSVREYVPRDFVLYQNYPNPFNPMTTIKYQLPVASKVTVTIYNLLGQEVNKLADEVQFAGIHSVEWNSTNSFGNQIASGVYFYRIIADGLTGENKGFRSAKKMILIK